MVEERKRLGGMKTVSQKDIDDSLKELFSKSKQPSKTFGQPIKTFKPEGRTIPKIGQPITPIRPVKEEPEPKEEEPYWDALEWEEWAVGIYKSYPEMRKYLPTWIIDAIESETE